mgnify:CR=1 FL=1
MPISLKEFQQRRRDLMNHMEPNSIAILASANGILRNAFTHVFFLENPI